MKNYRKIAMVTLTALSLGFASGCSSLGDKDKTLKGGALGAGAGALAGAAIGALTGGDWKKGMLIGAAAGLVVGTTTGIILDRQEEKLRKAGIRTKRDKDGRLLVSMSGNALRFKSGSSQLSANGKEQLKKVAQILKEYPENRIAIQGHTDSSGKASVNQMLSESRALAVQNTFRAYGVPAKCIVEAKGFGEEFPVADNKTRAGRNTNRRVELVISADEKEAKENQAKREKYKG